MRAYVCVRTHRTKLTVAYSQSVVIYPHDSSHIGVLHSSLYRFFLSVAVLQETMTHPFAIVVGIGKNF